MLAHGVSECIRGPEEGKLLNVGERTLFAFGFPDHPAD
jgi:hypothetical protein